MDLFQILNQLAIIAHFVFIKITFRENIFKMQKEGKLAKFGPSTIWFLY